MASLASSLETAGSWKLLTTSVVGGSLLGAVMAPARTAYAAPMNLTLAAVELGIWGVAGNVVAFVTGREGAKAKTRGVGTLLATAMTAGNVAGTAVGNAATVEVEDESGGGANAVYGASYGYN